MSAWLDSVECCYRWMTWPAWNSWIWERQNSAFTVVRFHCYMAFPAVDARLGSPRPQGHDSSKTETEPLRDWYLHAQGRAPTSVHWEAVPSLEEVFYGGLDSSILGHYSWPITFNCWLTRKPCVYYGSFLLIQRWLCLRASSAPGGPGPPSPKCSESSSPSLLPPLHLAEPWEQQIPSGQVIMLHPKLSAAVNTHSQSQQESCQVGHGSSLLAPQRVSTAAAPPREWSWGSVGGWGEETVLLLLLGVPGVAAGSIPPPGSTVILQDAPELHGKKQFPDCDTAACHKFMWHKYAAAVPVCTGCHMFLWEAGAVHPTDMAFVAVGGGRLYPAGWIELTVGLPVMGLVELMGAEGRVL